MIKLGIYWTLGDRGRNVTLEVIQALVDSGVSLLEIGLPFSDPLLDGPLIQQSHHRVTLSGWGFGDSVKLLSEVIQLTEKASKPIVQISLMTASQLIYDEKRRSLLPKVDGLLVTDFSSSHRSPFNLPSPRVWFVSQEVVLDSSFSGLPDEPISMIYLTRLKGITGAGQSAGKDTQKAIEKIKQHTTKPIWLGFGITTAEDLKQCEASGADGAIIGSAFVAMVNQALAENKNVGATVRSWVKEILQVDRPLI